MNYRNFHPESMESNQHLASQELEKVAADLEKDDSEFRMMLEERPYKDLEEYMRTKYPKVREGFQKAKQQNLKEEGIIIKDNDKSDEIRKAGNEVFNGGGFGYLNSLRYYYKALSFAETNDKLALCYGNISAVYFKLNEIKHCLSVTQKIMDLHLTKNQFYFKIIQRRRQCQQILSEKSQRIFPNRLPLSYSKNPNNPEIVGCIQRGLNGRIFTNQDLKIGDVIAVTKPFLKGSNMRSDFECCHNCFKMLIFPDPVVCNNCAFKLYCCKKCQAEDSKFHSMICEQAHLYGNLPNASQLCLNFAFKLLSKGIDIRKKEFKQPNMTPFDWNQKTVENQAKVVCTMKTSYNFSSSDKFNMINVYFVLMDRLSKSKIYRALISKFKNGEELFFKTYYKTLETLKVNSLTSDTTLDDNLPIYFDLYWGFFRHSCSPNVAPVRDAELDVIHYIVLEEIKSGDELFVCYDGAYFHLLDPENRRRHLKSKFGFECNCKACLNNWESSNEYKPTGSIIKLYNEIFEHVSKKGFLTIDDVGNFFRNISSFSLEEKLNMTKQICKIFCGLKNDIIYYF